MNGPLVYAIVGPCVIIIGLAFVFFAPRIQQLVLAYPVPDWYMPLWKALIEPVVRSAAYVLSFRLVGVAFVIFGLVVLTLGVFQVVRR